jgi:hypothetical protein
VSLDLELVNAIVPDPSRSVPVRFPWLIETRLHIGARLWQAAEVTFVMMMMMMK